MRKLREAFEIVKRRRIKFSNTVMLGIVYVVALARNFAEVLLGLATRAQYLIPQSAATQKTHEITSYCVSGG